MDFVLPTILRGSQRGLLVWDSASTHRAKDMKNFLAERRIDQVMIPAEMTSYLQTLDLVINKPFKDHLRKEVNNYIENRMERNQRGNLIKPNQQEIVNWVKNSWMKISDSCVSNALRAGYLDKNFTFFESFIGKHEKFGPMLLPEINSQEVQPQFENLTIYDDIPEEDEIVILE